MPWSEIPKPPTELLLEGSAYYQNRNDVRVPGNGTTFSYRSLLGQGPRPTSRITLLQPLDGDQGIRFVYAPLAFSGRGRLSRATQFNGATFAPGVDTRGRYQFDSYRLSYYRRVRSREGDAWRFGLTLKVRDAEVALSQPGLSRAYRNTGIVPLLHFGGRARLSDRWSAIVDFDGLIAPQGRALDLGVSVAYRTSERLHWYIGLRALDGGADNDRTYNAALFTYATAGVALRF